MPVTDPEMAAVNAYWVVRGRLMAGEYPGSPSPAETRARLASLLRAGVRAFIDLTEVDEVTRLGLLQRYEEDLRALAAESAAEVPYTRFPIRDFEVPTGGLMISILDAIDADLGRGMPANVHCLAGRGRTGTVVGCYVFRYAERLLGAAETDHAGALWPWSGPPSCGSHRTCPSRRSRRRSSCANPLTQWIKRDEHVSS
ncbi:MAG: hypothetical protein SCH98_11960 [Deferrisomatales bacterium]|nr:hypothetical protein [Deferrisomatales bacterium]